MNRQRFRMKLATSLVLLLTSAGLAHAIGVDDGFDPDANGLVQTIVQQRDGKLLVGGQFFHIGGGVRNSVARLLADGRADASFRPDTLGASGEVIALHELPLGDVLIGGSFTFVQGQPRTNIARVSKFGTVDPTFIPAIDGDVHAFASDVSPNGMTGFIYVGGQFTTVNGEQHNGLVRLLLDGSVDTSFVPPAFNKAINAIAMDANGRLLVAGAFTRIDNQLTDAPVARLNSDGSLDPTFGTQLSSTDGSNPTVSDLVVQPDGDILIAGSFDNVAGQQRNQVARLYSDGQLDEDFVPPEFDEAISDMLLQADGRIMVAGAFTNNVFRQGVARLYSDGSYDTSFSSVTEGEVRAVARQADGKYAIGGQISQIGIYVRNYIARLDESGAPDVDFIADVSEGPDMYGHAVALQANGGILLGGQASAPQKTRLIRMGGTGVRDSTFLPFFNNTVTVVISQPNEKIVVAGNFDNVGDRIARLNSDGSFDNTFTASADNVIVGGALQRDGRIVLGGLFTNISTVPHANIARLLLNGTPDPTFNASTSAIVRSVVIQPDGKILIGGEFTSVNTQPRAYIARLNADGSLDSGFEADVDGYVRSIAVDTLGRILIGGDFDSVEGVSRFGIARLLSGGSADTKFATNSYPTNTVVRSIALASNGVIIIAGGTSSGTGFIRRLFANGQEDVSFDPGFVVATSFIQSLVIQPDGKLLFAGLFASVDDEPRSIAARYAQIGYAMESFDLINGSDLVWSHKGYGPELTTAPSVLYSTSCCNREDFVPLPNGLMHRVDNTWVLEDIPTTGEGTIWLRAVSIAGDGGHSVFPVESPIFALTLDGNVEPDDRIFANGFD